MILGYGVAGKAALAALLERDPLARVLVVDARADADQSRPPCLSTSASGGGDGSFASAWRRPAAGAGVEFASGARATALNADRGLVTLSLPPAAAGAASSGGDSSSGDYSSSSSGGGGGGGGRDQTADGSREGAAEVSAPVQQQPLPPRKEEVIGFGRCLLALGSRPRPPPPGFIDPEARGSVALLGAREGDGGASRDELRREIVAGRSVTIVGSSWQALELACWLQQEGRSASTIADRVRRRGRIDETKWGWRGARVHQLLCSRSEPCLVASSGDRQ